MQNPQSESGPVSDGAVAVETFLFRTFSKHQLHRVDAESLVGFCMKWLKSGFRSELYWVEKFGFPGL